MQLDDTGRHHYSYFNSQPSSTTSTPAYPVNPSQFGPQEYSTALFTPQFTPPKKRGRKAELIAVTVLVLIALGVGGAFAYAKARANGALSAEPSTATLRSACEKEIRDEFNRRNSANDSRYVIAVLSSIVVEEEVHRDTATHYSINGSFTATAAAALVGSIPMNVLVSCQITTKGDQVVIVAVINR
jgi:hypothetical protein